MLVLASKGVWGALVMTWHASRWGVRVFTLVVMVVPVLGEDVVGGRILVD